MYAIRAPKMVGGTLNVNCHTYCLPSCSLFHILHFSKGPDMKFGFQQHDNVNPNSLIKKNVKGKNCFASFLGHLSLLSHSSCLVSFPKYTRCQILFGAVKKKKIMGYSLKVVEETFERGCVFPASFNILAIRKRKGRFSVSVSSGGTALPMHLVPKGCSNRALLEWLLEIDPAVKSLLSVQCLSWCKRKIM